MKQQNILMLTCLKLYQVFANIVIVFSLGHKGDSCIYFRSGGSFNLGSNIDLKCGLIRGLWLNVLYKYSTVDVEVKNAQ